MAAQADMPATAFAALAGVRLDDGCGSAHKDFCICSQPQDTISRVASSTAGCRIFGVVVMIIGSSDGQLCVTCGRSGSRTGLEPAHPLCSPYARIAPDVSKS